MKNTTFFKTDTCFLHDENITEYCNVVPFDPPQIYPEFSSVHKHTNAQNLVYSMVRNILKNLNLDKENFGTPQWNPLGVVIQPGMTVILKPNLVLHRHYLGEHHLYSTITHGSVLRPLVDYAYLALKGEGKVVIADNPVDNADFDKLMEFTKIRDMVDELRNRGLETLEVLDLRPKCLKEGNDGRFYHHDLSGDPLGYATVDLRKDSLFAEFDDNPNIHYYTLADPSVDHIDPKFRGKSLTDEYHNAQTHKYIVSKSILNADVIINVAKLKGHCKSGVSLNLKNMIGAVHEKFCMPHHRPGPPPEGDSFPQEPASHYVQARKLYTKLRTTIRIHKFPGFRSFRNLLQRKKILIGQHIEHGNWKGNDTIWRTILDLNRIILYANGEGEMQNSIQRNYFCFIDGIISQQGEAPMNGEAVATSILFAGYNPVMVDALAVKAMGIACDIKPVSQAINLQKWKLMPDGADLSFSDKQVPNLNFKLTKGWM